MCYNKTMKIPITQSEAWKKLQDDLGETSFYEKKGNYEYLAILKSTPVGNYLYLPYGPVYKDKSGFEETYKALKELAKSHNAIFIRVESLDPDFKSYAPKGTVKSKDLNPADTWVLDLTPEKADIISGFSQGTRTRFNTFAKKGLSVTSTTDPNEIKHLVTLQNKLYKTKNLNVFSEKYLKTELAQPFSTLYLVKYNRPETVDQDANLPKENQILAASLFFDYEDTRYYMQSAADIDYKKLPATVALLTTAIFDAKEKGIKYFDFWGIAPDVAPKDHPWAGFTEFKKSFGGEAKHYAGTYDIVLKPAKYKLYHATRRFGRIIHKS